MDKASSNEAKVSSNDKFYDCSFYPQKRVTNMPGVLLFCLQTVRQADYKRMKLYVSVGMYQYFSTFCDQLLGKSNKIKERKKSGVGEAEKLLD